MDFAVMTAATKASEDLPDLDEDALYEELAARLLASEDEGLLGDMAALNAAAYLDKGLGDTLRKFGKAFFNSWIKQIYELTCGDADQYAEARKEIGKAFETGVDTVIIGALTAGLATVGLAPAVALVVATIAVRTLLGVIKEVGCDALKKKLTAEPTPA